MNTIGYFSVGPPVDYSKTSSGFLITTTFTIKPTKVYSIKKFEDWLELERYAPKPQVCLPMYEAPVDVPVIDVDGFKPRQSLLSRYGQKVINNKYYGVISIGSDGIESKPYEPGSKKSND